MSESKKQKSRGVEANPAFDCQLDDSVALTELFQKLKREFTAQAEEAKRQLDETKR